MASSLGAAQWAEFERDGYVVVCPHFTLTGPDRVHGTLRTHGVELKVSEQPSKQQSGEPSRQRRCARDLDSQPRLHRGCWELLGPCLASAKRDRIADAKQHQRYFCPEQGLGQVLDGLDDEKQDTGQHSQHQADYCDRQQHTSQRSNRNAGPSTEKPQIHGHNRPDQQCHAEYVRRVHQRVDPKRLSQRHGQG